MRWERQLVDREAGARLPGYRDVTVRHFDVPEAVDTRFYEVHAKSILNHVPEASQMPFRWTVNPYRGCTHACAYCFARPTHEFLEFNAGRDFEREIVVKVNAPELLRTELSRGRWRGEHVALGTNTDPYQWVEKRYELMRGIWTALRDARNPCSVLTKSPLLLRDLDLMVELDAITDFSAALSIPTLDQRTWRATEPRSPSPRARLDAITELASAGIRTGVLVAPLMPGINDSPAQVREVVRLATEAGAGYVTGIALHLRPGVREVFMEWLAGHRPELMPRYEELYRRGAYMPAAERRRLAQLLEGPLMAPGERFSRVLQAGRPASEVTPEATGAAGHTGAAAGHTGAAAGRTGAAAGRTGAAAGRTGAAAGRTGAAAARAADTPNPATGSGEWPQPEPLQARLF